MNFRSISLIIAESVDAWRIIPRTILVLYSTLVFNLYLWFKSIPTYVQEQCDAATLRVLMESGMVMDDAKNIACYVVDVVGGPTAAQSAFVTTIIGLSTGIFGLYVATGRKWERNRYDNNPFPYPHMPKIDDSHDPYPQHPHRPYPPEYYDNNFPRRRDDSREPSRPPPRGPWGDLSQNDDN